MFFCFLHTVPKESLKSIKFESTLISGLSLQNTIVSFNGQRFHNRRKVTHICNSGTKLLFRKVIFCWRLLIGRTMFLTLAKASFTTNDWLQIISVRKVTIWLFKEYISGFKLPFQYISLFCIYISFSLLLKRHRKNKS